MFMFMYNACICVYIPIYLCVYVYMYICIYVYICLYMSIYVNMYGTPPCTYPFPAFLFRYGAQQADADLCHPGATG